ncbi:hypothetical protein Nwat_1445 [Nitrosococcus watsonii C-113]|uniref:Uncharacterized protein n=1 Tax=Nitrosococcus watsoni (strain C-113) TaxID=105559 RepID=D8K628_NITWC|nr:hypothetical protein Nwat_1445 [Nitrosococcus watsonii C-113]
MNCPQCGGTDIIKNGSNGVGTSSKKLENHVGAIGYFVHHYNATLCPTTRSRLSLTMQDYRK